MSIGSLLTTNIGPIMYSIYKVCEISISDINLTEDLMMYVKDRILKTLTAMSCQMLKSAMRKTPFPIIFPDENLQKKLKSIIFTQPEEELSFSAPITPQKSVSQKIASPMRITLSIKKDSIKKSPTSPLIEFGRRLDEGLQNLDDNSGQPRRQISSPLDLKNSHSYITNLNNLRFRGTDLGKRGMETPDSLRASDEHFDMSYASNEKVSFAKNFSNIKISRPNQPAEFQNERQTANSIENSPSKTSSSKFRLLNLLADGIGATIEDVLATVKQEADSCLDDGERSILSTAGKIVVKYEGPDLPKIRKKVCRRIYVLLVEDVGLSKNTAKTVALTMEAKVQAYCDSKELEEKTYLAISKVLYQKITVGLAHIEYTESIRTEKYTNFAY